MTESTALSVFESPEGKRIRVVMRAGEPWFVATELCTVLGLDRARDALSALEADEKVRDSIAETGILDDLVSEGGFYSLVMRSRKPEAKAFKRWVTHEVLPTIRKTGGYNLPALPTSFAEALELAAKQAREIEMQQAKLVEADRRLEYAAPRVAYVENFVDGASDGVTMKVVAAQLGVGEQALREHLRAHRIIQRRTVGRRADGGIKYEWYPDPLRRAWFKVMDQPQAPRLHNNQPQTTMYVTPAGKVGIRNFLARVPMKKDDEQPPQLELGF